MQKRSTPNIHCWTTQPPTINTPRDEDADGAHTKDTPMDDTAHGSPTRIHCWTTQLLTSTPRNEDTDGAHSADPTMDDTAHESTRRIHCWTMQLLTTHQGMRIQMEHTLWIQRWMTLQMGAQHGSTDG
uniref:Uncharacterized protein LOC111114887 n=1 Tax=Crassostrea virginica TaxID=6565 RepID=A0A8B8C204_CRAVI|nr:uncharacterized protein LOC111114887 [Crassostrea virginica]